MNRTPEQVAAEEALTSAVDQYRAAHGHTVSDAVLTDFILLYVEQGFGDDGRSFSRYGYLCAGEAIPAYRVLGLIEVAGMQLRRDLGAPA